MIYEKKGTDGVRHLFSTAEGSIIPAETDSQLSYVNTTGGAATLTRTSDIRQKVDEGFAGMELRVKDTTTGEITKTVVRAKAGTRVLIPEGFVEEVTTPTPTQAVPPQPTVPEEPEEDETDDTESE